jgi:hypothetical protein
MLTVGLPTTYPRYIPTVLEINALLLPESKSSKIPFMSGELQKQSRMLFPQM